MKAFAVTGPGTFTFVDIDIPEIDDYEVLVKNEGCSICNTTDWMITDRLYATKDYPVLLGHESFGKVIKIGKKVRNYKLGDRVICANARPTGYDGTYYSSWGAFAEYGVAGDYHALVEDGQPMDGAYAYRNRYFSNDKIDPNLPAEKATLVFPMSETASCILQVPEVKDEDVAIFGAGTVGCTLALFAKLYGAKSVTVFDIRKEKAEQAVAIGADYAALSDEAYTAGKKYGVVYEATGKNTVFERGLPFLKENGVLAVYGVSTLPYHFNLNAVPTNWHYRTVSPRPVDAIPFVEDLLWKDKLPVSKILTHIWPFAEAEKAMRQVKNGEAMKGLVLIEGYADGVKVN